MTKKSEACGRCSMTSVVDVAESDGEGGGADPFDGPRIEVADADARRASFPAVWLGRAKDRLDAAATRLIDG